MISAAGFETITTHVFDRGDPHLGEDALFGVKRGTGRRFPERQGQGERVMALDFTFVMVAARNGRRAA